MPSYKGRMRSVYLEKGMRMSFLETMLARAKADKQTIVLPEGNDPRTLEAAEKLIAYDACNVIVLGNEEELKAGGRELRGVRIIDPETSDLREKFATRLYELRKHKGMTPEDALDKISDVLYFGVMMVKCGEADGMVSGAWSLDRRRAAPLPANLEDRPGREARELVFRDGGPRLRIRPKRHVHLQRLRP